MTSLHLLQQGREYVYINRSILSGFFSRMKKLEAALSISVSHFNQPACVHDGFCRTPGPNFPRLRDPVSSPSQLLQSDGCWIWSGRRRICSAVNYSACSLFTSLREVGKPLACPSSGAPAVAHHPSLASAQSYFGTDQHDLGDKVCSAQSPTSTAGRSLFASQLDSLCLLLPKFE